MNGQRPLRVMFVCAGNICRSPMAEAVFRHQVASAGLRDRFEIASSGTGGWHVGEKPHPGTQAVLQRYGVALGEKRAMKLSPRDLEHYDYVLAMDEENLDDIRRLRQAPHAQVYRLLDFAPELGLRDVPDPYYSGAFERVYSLVTQASQALLNHIRRTANL